MKHIYAFGSVCRGEIDAHSDADILIICDCPESYEIKYGGFSIYGHDRLRELWDEGNPFAWHLHLESKMLFTSDGRNFLHDLGCPEPYTECESDCGRFFDLFVDSASSLETSNRSTIFDLSTIFLAIRNFATCYSLSFDPAPTFSRHAALCLSNKPLNIDKEVYSALERSRLLSTRGQGDVPTREEVSAVLKECQKIKTWMTDTLNEVRHEK